jgi:hypothetical protein
VNYLANISYLKNTYYSLRHGISLANQARIILSNVMEGSCSWGLYLEGKDEVARSVGKDV